MKIEKDFVHLARLALSGRPQDIQLHLRRVSKRLGPEFPALAEAVNQLLREAPTRSSPLRREAKAPLPVDLDSRLELLRTEAVSDLDVEPVFAPELGETLRQLIRERRAEGKLAEEGLRATSAVLFTGPPGVGKSLAARWIARELELPLLTLDLSAVMSSFLGRTGNNIRYVLDYAKQSKAVLLLDELDAIAKRRDDTSEVGELKRLVTVLLQEIDDWPSTGLLIAATNHAGLLDPAVWRRFDLHVDFPMPDDNAVAQAVERFLGPETNGLAAWQDALAVALRGSSFSDIERTVMRGRRMAALDGGSADAYVSILSSLLTGRSAAEKKDIAASLVATDAVSQRRAYDITGVSRDTIRRILREREEA